jgi:hypothetical protein
MLGIIVANDALIVAGAEATVIEEILDYAA